MMSIELNQMSTVFVFDGVDRTEPTSVELLEPSSDSLPGESIFIDGYKTELPRDVLNPKKKIWDKLQVIDVYLIWIQKSFLSCRN